MHTVYGIYTRGRSKPVYVGRTVGTMEDRFYEHVNNGVNDFRFGNGGQKAYWMHEHFTGKRKLSIRAIAQNLTPANAQAIENALIRYLKPILNKQPKVTMLTQFRRKKSMHITPKPVQGNPLRRRLMDVKELVNDKHWAKALALMDPSLNEHRWMMTQSANGSPLTLNEELILKVEAACEKLLEVRKSVAAKSSTPNAKAA